MNFSSEMVSVFPFDPFLNLNWMCPIYSQLLLVTTKLVDSR